MKARLVTHDGCEKIVDAITDSKGTPSDYYRTVSFLSIIGVPESGYDLSSTPVPYKERMYVLVGYEYLITSKSCHKEPRAVYWEE